MSITNTQTKSMIIAQHTAAVVVGLGVTGYSAVRYLLARGLSVSVVDSATKPALAKQLADEFPKVTCYFGDFDSALPNQILYPL